MRSEQPVELLFDTLTGRGARAGGRCLPRFPQHRIALSQFGRRVIMACARHVQPFAPERFFEMTVSSRLLALALFCTRSAVVVRCSFKNLSLISLLLEASDVLHFRRSCALARSEQEGFYGHQDDLNL
jgi:hypothetical protein